MNPEYDIYEQIDQYLSNNLSQEDLILFNSKMATDKLLQELVEAQKLANEIIIDNEMIRLKERMQMDLGKGGNGGANHVKIIVSTILIISASVGSYIYFSSDISSGKGTVSKSLNESLNIKTNGQKVISNPKKAENLTQENNSNKINNRSNDLSKISIQSNISESEDNEIPKFENMVSSPPSFTTNNKVTFPVESKKINCDEIKIEANTKVDFGFNNSEATIIIDKKSIHGGVAPYLFSLDNEAYTASSKFENVKEGIYSLYIKDNNNCICILQQPIVVKQVVEPKEIDEAFNPSNGDKWTFPITINQDGEISIYNKGGSIVYSARINGGSPSEWDGRDVNGNELITGNYYFIIKFTNSELVKGHITIVR
jgi:gliding motility-associated-like protein